MANKFDTEVSKITGKTLQEMLQEATLLNVGEKFKDYAYESTGEVHVMGMHVTSVYFSGITQQTNLGAFFKDTDFLKPVTDDELLAIFFKEITTFSKSYSSQHPELCTGISLTNYFEGSADLHLYEYKDSNLTYQYYGIDRNQTMFISGETYKALMGFVPGDIQEEEEDPSPSPGPTVG